MLCGVCGVRRQPNASKVLRMPTWSRAVHTSLGVAALVALAQPGAVAPPQSSDLAGSADLDVPRRRPPRRSAAARARSATTGWASTCPPPGRSSTCRPTRTPASGSTGRPSISATLRRSRTAPPTSSVTLTPSGCTAPRRRAGSPLQRAAPRSAHSRPRCPATRSGTAVGFASPARTSSSTPPGAPTRNRWTTSSPRRPRHRGPPPPHRTTARTTAPHRRPPPPHRRRHTALLPLICRPQP